MARRAVQADESTHNEPFPVTAEMVAHAIRAADERGRRHRERRGASG